LFAGDLVAAGAAPGLATSAAPATPAALAPAQIQAPSVTIAARSLL